MHGGAHGQGNGGLEAAQIMRVQDLGELLAETISREPRRHVRMCRDSARPSTPAITSRPVPGSGMVACNTRVGGVVGSR
jgi:hypothetical protein